MILKPSPRLEASGASSTSSFSNDLLDRNVTLRAQIVPSPPNQTGLSEILHAALGIDCELYGLVIGSLATSIHGAGKVATISFETTPEVLIPTPEGREWKFTNVYFGGSAIPVSVTLDTHFLGLTVLHSTEDSEKNPIDCVAISGIGSHAFGSFKERRGTHMWLRDALPNDFPNLRIITYGYHSALDKKPSAHEIEDFGRDFRDHLRQMGSFIDLRRPFVFIAHSFGGIVVKEALLQLSHSTKNALDQAIVKSVKALLGFGVPNLGFDVRSLIPIVSGQVNQSFVESMMDGSSKLTKLDEEWMTLVQSHHIELFGFYETLDSPTAIMLNGRWRMAGPSVRLIDKASATSGHQPQQTEAIFRTHSEMIKLKRDDDVYFRVRGILRKVTVLSGGQANPVGNGHRSGDAAEQEPVERRPADRGRGHHDHEPGER